MWEIVWCFGERRLGDWAGLERMEGMVSEEGVGGGTGGSGIVIGGAEWKGWEIKAGLGALWSWLDTS